MTTEPALELFDVHGVDIERWDPVGGQIVFEYTVERGERLPADPIPLFGFRRHVVETRAPLHIERQVECPDNGKHDRVGQQDVL